MGDPDAGVPPEQIRLAKEEGAAWERYGEASRRGAAARTRRAAFNRAVAATEALMVFERSLREPTKVAA